MVSHQSAIVLAGPSGAGKSTLCRRMIDVARRRGIGVGGVVAEARVKGGGVVGLDAVNTAGGKRVALAEFNRPTGGPVTGRWHFHPEAFQVGLEWCRQATQGDAHRLDVAQGFLALSEVEGSPAGMAGLKACPTPDQRPLLVIDELGPLELVQGLGWAAVLPLLRDHDGPVIAVVRPSLVESFIAAMGNRALTRIDVTPDTRDEAFERALEVLGWPA